MAQNLALRMKTGQDGKKDPVSESIFEIIDDYLGPLSSQTAEDAAMAFDRLAPKEGYDDMAAFLWSAWSGLVDMVEQIPYNHPAQDKLVRVLRELTLLPDTKIGDVSLFYPHNAFRSSDG
jgi:hypothetical protein